MKTAFLFLLCCLCATAFSQDTTAARSAPLPVTYLDNVSNRVASIEQKLDKHTSKALAALERQEQKIRRKVARLDSTKAADVFSDLQERYNSLRQKLEHPEGLTSYIPYFDTLKTSLKFLTQHKELLQKADGLDDKLEGTLSKVKGLESSLSGAETVKSFIQERKAYLRESLQNLPFAKELQKLNKQAYYYAAQVAEYKEILNDGKKLERKAIELLSKTKMFQDFMRRNSQLASLFGIPGGDGDDPASAVSIAGLQTRAQVQDLIAGRLGTGGPDAQVVLQQNMQAAQAQLSQLKDKMAKLGVSTGGSEADLPDFKPNAHKTKSLLNRLEWGSNLQTVKGTRFFPVTSDIGLSLGYRLNDKSVIGVGAAYKVGWGSGWDQIRITHQGVGLRSYIDYKLKGSLYVSGGYEQNYRSQFQNIQQLKDYSAWQTSGLIGLSKKYKVSSKFKGNMQLLYDFMSYRQIPRTQAVLFRVGYGL